MPVARGTFRLDLRPAGGEGPEGMGRFTFDKSFDGDLSGTSQGVMLSAGDPGTGHAGYVVVEMVDAEIDGRTGGFALQQFGLMQGGAPDLTIAVTPGSGTGDFTGMTGHLALDVDTDGTHRYTLDYTL